MYVQAVTNVQKKYHNRNELQRQAYVPLPMSTSLSILSTSGLSAKFLRTRHHRLRCGSSSHAMRSSAAADGDHAGLSGIRCASLANGATHTFVAAAAGQHNDGARCRGDGGLDGFDVVALRRGRCRGAELRERAAPRGRRPGTDGHYSSLNLRSVSQRVVVGAQGGPAGAQEGNR